MFEENKHQALLHYGTYLRTSSGEHAASLRCEMDELKVQFSETEEQMRLQNETLQDEVASLENALRMEREQPEFFQHP